MLTDHTNLLANAENLRGSSVAAPASAAQKVAIINGSPEILALVENVLSAGHYDIVFVESVAHAYSHIKRVQPNLVILCVHFDNMDALQVLSMLKLDEETRGIPVLTYTAGYEVQEEEDDEEEDEADPSAISMFAAAPGMRMN
jgi:PleD family two-component response regulator